MKWHFEVGGLSRTPINAIGLENGGFVVSVTTDKHTIYTFDEDANLLATRNGATTGYHGRGGIALTSDSQGNVYLALTTGLRPAPQVTVCKFPAYAVGIAPQCVGLEDAIDSAAYVSDIEVPAPNRIVIAYGTSPDASAVPGFTSKVSSLNF